jgi:antitoxin ChpS
MTGILREEDGDVVLALPSELLNMLQLKAGARVGVSVENGRLIIERNPRPHYTVEELLAESDYSQPMTAAEREWVDAPAIGGELI